MAELKTKKTQASVKTFLDAVENDQRRADCRTVQKLMKQATGKMPKMWGASMVGFGDYHYKYASGREGDTFQVGFSPRKANLSMYLLYDLASQKALLDKLGKHKVGKGCLYVNKLDDIDLGVLKKLIEKTVARHKKSG